ncbi:DUF2637 domain-containing protein [Kineosporia sp. J2-2]|uniref:DUF2637 domain-containing protein n=1 Tax=Kineosporia corallincola TaxID=2835133 RepID=A0ABS5TJT8_9ACTN|nr:DUF2637 domain-containing protein [Kineosporia corallincola]MBT0771360.1 DUF2637 domain-containing protein [Kineosporia corallincola]
MHDAIITQHTTEHTTEHVIENVTGAAAPVDGALARQAQRLALWARIVLVPVAVIGAVLSYRSLYKAALPTFGPQLAAGFPLLVDLLILGASLQYVAGAKVGRPMNGWRLTAHLGVAGTLVLNALAAHELGEVPWHVTAPAVWAVLVELTGKQVLGQWKAVHHGQRAAIAVSLWLSAPIESARTRLLMARTGLVDATVARIQVGTVAAAREALLLSLPRRASARRDARRVRRVVNRQLRAGSLPPAAVLGAVGWNGDLRSDLTPENILRAVVQNILHPVAPAPAAASVELGSAVGAVAGPDEAEARTERAVIANALRERHPQWPAETIDATAADMTPGEALPTPAPQVSAASGAEASGEADAEVDVEVDTVLDIVPDEIPGEVDVPEAAVASRPVRRAGRTTSTRVRVQELRAKHPQWSAQQIAERVGVTDRTARRYLAEDNENAA